MITGIFLIRHGETKWNSEGVFRGRSDIPLNKNGLKQAKATGDYLQKIDFAAVYCSPLSRARQTAAALCLKRSIKPQLRDALTDISFGPWEGKRYDELASLYPEEIKTWREQPQRHNLSGAETLAEAGQRAFSEMKILAEANQGKIIALVSHRVILKLLILQAINLGSEAFWKIKQDTCCINMLEYNPESGFVIVRLNDTCHLKPITALFEQQDF